MTTRIERGLPLAGDIEQTPSYVFDESTLVQDANAARDALATCGAHLLFAMKSCACVPVLERLSDIVDGLHASSLFEAKLGRQVLGSKGVIHVTTPAIAAAEVDELCDTSDLISCNSLTQWDMLRNRAAGKASLGLRLNPDMSFIPDERYDPCRRHSKLGAPIDDVREVLEQDPKRFDGLEGLLIHTNSESQDFRELLATVERLDELLSPLLSQLKWIDLGGGYLYRDGTDYGPLNHAVSLLRSKYDLKVYMEPGTSIIQRAGTLVATVLDVFPSSGLDVAVLDASVNHLPESYELQFSPDARGDKELSGFRYILAGATCLAGDIFGDYEFVEPLLPGDRVVLEDVGAYSMVKAHMFNGVNMPSVYWKPTDGTSRLVKQFTFSHFLERCGVKDDANL